MVRPAVANEFIPMLVIDVGKTRVESSVLAKAKSPIVVSADPAPNSTDVNTTLFKNKYGAISVKDAGMTACPFPSTNVAASSGDKSVQLCNVTNSPGHAQVIVTVPLQSSQANVRVEL